MTPALALVAALAVSIAPEPDARSFTGAAVVRLAGPAGGAREVRLAADGLSVASVSFDGKKSSFSSDRGVLSVRFDRALPEGATAELRVDYSGGREAGLVFLRGGSVYGRSEAEGGGRWFPGPQDAGARLVAEISARAPEGLTAVSNGRLGAPAPARLVALYLGRYVALDAAADVAGRRVPVISWVPPGREAEGRRAFGRAPAMLEFYSGLFGVPYPWTAYSQTVVRDPLDDGLENAAASRFDEAVLRGDDELVAHELVHQWFGAWVSRRAGAPAWPDEGAASYFASVWLGQAGGPDALSWSLFEKKRDASVYGRGAWFFHRLRRELGEAAFSNFLRSYLKEGRAADGDELRRAAEAASGKDLSSFFARDIAGPVPRLSLTLSYDEASRRLAVRAPRPVSGLRLPVVLSGGAELIMDFTAGASTFSWPVAARPAWAAVDPGQTELVEVERQWPEDMLRAELASGPTAASRARSAEDLAASGSPESIATLGDRLLRDPFWGVSVECARALGRGAGDGAYTALAAGAGAADPRVRRAVVEALGSFSGGGSAADALLENAAGDADEDVAASALRSLGHRRAPSALKLLTAKLAVDSPDEVTRRAALEGLGLLGDPAALPSLRDWSAPGHSGKARAAALSAWSALRVSPAQLLAVAQAALRDDDDLWVRRAGAAVLK